MPDLTSGETLRELELRRHMPALLGWDGLALTFDVNRNTDLEGTARARWNELEVGKVMVSVQFELHSALGPGQAGRLHAVYGTGDRRQALLATYVTRWTAVDYKTPAGKLRTGPATSELRLLRLDLPDVRRVTIPVLL